MTDAGPSDALSGESKRVAPRSPRAALEPEYMPEPKRPSRRARHPLVIAGNAIFTIILVIALAGGLAWSFGKHKFEAAGPLDREQLEQRPRLPAADFAVGQLGAVPDDPERARETQLDGRTAD